MSAKINIVVIKWYRRCKRGNGVILCKGFTAYCFLKDELARQRSRIIPFQKMRRVCKPREHEKKVQGKAGNLECLNDKGQRHRADDNVENKTKAREMPRYGQHW